MGARTRVIPGSNPGGPTKTHSFSLMMSSMKLFIWLNVHVVNENDWSFVENALRNVVAQCKIMPISSTEVMLEIHGSDTDEIVRKILSLKFVDRVGIVVKELVVNKISDLINYIRSIDYFLIPRVRDIRIRSVILRETKSKPVQENFLIVRDYYDNSRLIISFIMPYRKDLWYDIFNMWHECFSNYKPTFVVTGISSENELLSCVRIAAALRVRLYLCSTNIRFSSRKKYEEFKRFVSIAKVRIYRSLEDIVNILKRRNVRIVCLSMHCHKGERNLLDIFRDGRDTAFIIGSEKWGLSVKEIELCDDVLRLGPSTGIPMSISEVISYITSTCRLASYYEKTSIFA